MPSSPPTVLGGSAFLTRIIQKQESHGTQSMGFYFSPTPNPLINAFKPAHCVERGCLPCCSYFWIPRFRGERRNKKRIRYQPRAFVTLAAKLGAILVVYYYPQAHPLRWLGLFLFGLLF